MFPICDHVHPRISGGPNSEIQLFSYWQPALKKKGGEAFLAYIRKSGVFPELTDNFETILFCFMSLAVQRGSENRLITMEYYTFPAVFSSNDEHIPTLDFGRKKLLQHTRGMQVTKDAPYLEKGNFANEILFSFFHTALALYLSETSSYLTCHFFLPQHIRNFFSI